ncbi:unnamed protein product [Phytophthora fragariaefolia]|uniref:Unnamed protein product n=1 Tax=Phytophthora fragariaefolia TaxID=1490495 RepID=A0A9W6X2H9_9STRA|nr:unnamed protein product [Phytophthora fragariaefolia]
MFMLQMRLWSVASHADMRANAISAERGPPTIDLPPIKQDEDRERVTREDMGVTQRPSYDRVVEPALAINTALGNEQQNLRVSEPLSTPAVVVVPTPAPPTATKAAASVATTESTATPIATTSFVDRQDVRVDDPLPTPGVVDVPTSAPTAVQPAAPVAAFGSPDIPVATSKAVLSFADRHDVVSGYDAAMKYLANYTTPAGSDERLFLFFVCGDEHGLQTTWRQVCVDASKLVYDVFAKSPSRNRLLTIHAGSKQYWSAPNAFFKDGDLKVKMIPGIMQWHGGHPGAKRATSGMIIEESMLYEPLLRYLFKNEDTPDPLLAPDKIASKEIVFLKGYKDYRQYMDAVAAGTVASSQGPMFLLLVAGRLESNNRQWCPYCRYSEISVEYAFYAFAPPGSRFVKVETVNSYGTWKNPANEWKQDTALKVRGVPWMAGRTRSDGNDITTLPCTYMYYLPYHQIELHHGRRDAHHHGSAPTEQLSNLRKASGPLHVPSDDALDVEIAARVEEQRRIEERARQIPIKVVLPTTAPPTQTPDAAAAAERPAELLKADAAEELVGRVPGMPLQTVGETAAAPVQPSEVTAAAPVQPSEVAAEAAVQPVVVAMRPPEQAVTRAVQAQVAPVEPMLPLGARHQEISGYEATMKFLENYQQNPDESLFLFFMCSDEQFKAKDWSKECAAAKKHVHDVFSKSPNRNKLVTVFAGSEKYWKHQNDFYNDPDLRVKGVPCLMKWEGHNGQTSGMLVQKSLLDEPFLRYLFKNTDQPEALFVADNIKNKQIVTVNGYDAYVDAMVKFEKEEIPVPTFLMMVSGRFKNNKRPWCPYCRYSELPLEYAFYSYAPKNARMIRVEVTDSYSEWRKRNEFTRDENLQLKIVPLMFKIDQIPAAGPNASKSIKFTAHKFRYDELAPLREFFTSFT